MQRGQSALGIDEYLEVRNSENIQGQQWFVHIPRGSKIFHTSTQLRNRCPDKDLNFFTIDPESTRSVRQFVTSRNTSNPTTSTYVIQRDMRLLVLHPGFNAPDLLEAYSLQDVDEDDDIVDFRDNIIRSYHRHKIAREHGTVGVLLVRESPTDMLTAELILFDDTCSRFSTVKNFSSDKD
jgi:hypothetical protein